MHHRVHGPGLILILACLAHPAIAGPPEMQQTLDIISAYAEKICGEFELKGKTQKLEIAGTAKAELDSLLKRLADIGLSGTGKFETASYSNVLQSELGNRLNVVTACRSKISGDMNVLLVQAMQLSPAAGSQTINNNGNHNTNIIGNQNGSIGK